MKKTLGALSLLLLLVLSFGSVAVLGSTTQLVVTDFSLQGTAFSVEVTNTEATSTSGVLDVSVVSNGAIIETHSYPITVGGLDSILINGTITDDLNPLEYLTLSLR